MTVQASKQTIKQLIDLGNAIIESAEIAEKLENESHERLRKHGLWLLESGKRLQDSQ